MTDQNDDPFYYVTNYRGDVVRIIDENGATVANYSYDPWGKVLSVSENAAVAGQPLGYAGYYYDRETKLYYLQARYYDPETARFLSRDPDPGDLDNPLSQNAYIYTENNPVMYTDPNGYSNKWYDLGQGWKARIDSAKGSTQKHAHLYGPKGQHYSQNADGSIHDKHKNSSGEPPKWVKKALKQKTKWDWDANAKKYEKKQKEKKTKDAAKKAAKVGAAAGAGYIVYRGVRMAPSLLPPLWPTLPANLVIP
ncbi:RHS repeat-associated core domain-containing protein [Anoxybacteroides rupiense]|uniref:RHS repeat-associated core domain-containing protein n=1 Tax=Anoxybacteroides rupiense TaxID=311460 RepID=A0ABD5IXN8_9BACL|nr:RHS repeat-associated core domain-containing protein [Anoxybacillus rupiensis]MBB3909368.1 RHS repeat-associated protein [Anoxybacillus rupiensis]MED5052161.1 RHS repeat-associated core domain-containing protein [Anoxybacillus rupiensis]